MDDLPSLSEIFEHEVVSIVSRTRYDTESGEHWEEWPELADMLSNVRENGALPSENDLYSLEEKAPETVQDDIEYIHFLRDAAEGYRKFRDGDRERRRVELKDLLLPLEQLATETNYPETGIKGHAALGVPIGTIRKNYLKHAPDAELFVYGEEQDQKIGITICDDGPGLKQDLNPQKLFEGNETGLPISETIMRSYGAEINYFKPEREGFGLELGFDKF